MQAVDTDSCTGFVILKLKPSISLYAHLFCSVIVPPGKLPEPFIYLVSTVETDLGGLVESRTHFIIVIYIYIHFAFV
jgi:hypothetical protein